MAALPHSWRNWLGAPRRQPSQRSLPADASPGSLAELMTLVLRSADRRALAGQLLATDPLYHRLPPEGRQTAIDLGLEAGSGAARKLATEHGTADPFVLAEALGTRISFSKREARIGSQVHYSEYRGGSASITINQQAMDEVNAAISRYGLEAHLGILDITPVHVAHELYHHIELHSKPAPTAGFRVTTLAVGPIRLDSGLMALSEIAANAFAQELLGLRYYPTVLEFITVYQHNAPLAWELLGKLEERSV